ncbi:MAG: hypothetical protein HC838_09975 [Spirulinaceae cyanobacterium RM2_2_10]|nr:hypothetical protein [Spirulinaceae cyanobacterium RM2_2_10]
MPAKRYEPPPGGLRQRLHEPDDPAMIAAGSNRRQRCGRACCKNIDLPAELNQGFG